MKQFRVVGVAVAALIFLLLVLRPVFSGAWVLPQMLSLGPVSIRYYGVCMALAVAVGWLLASKRAPQYGFTTEHVDDMALWLTVGGFVGARLYHVLSSFSFYLAHPAEVLMVWHGGLSIFGALFGGFAALLLFVWCQRHSLIRVGVSKSAFDTGVVWRWLDLLAPSVLLGQIIGRFGNLFNYEAYGYPTNLPWKMFVPSLFRFPAYADAAFYHPLFLYEALGNALILVFLFWFARSTLGKRAAGVVFISYIILYTVLRFSLEHIRMDSLFVWAGVRENALMSGILALAAGMLFVWRYFRVWQKQ
ncbi:MAG: prolipoprotein diacylglyceryl transferase [Candidatus Doudnabacteria bacterium]|nr:prolipoprotein diacylglyceryl transferase [Candidatus Doudnabacteria bacterium]